MFACGIRVTPESRGAAWISTSTRRAICSKRTVFPSSVGVAFGRQFIGALTLLGIAAVTRMPLPRRWQQLRHVAVVAFLLNAFPSFLFAQAEQHVSSVMVM